MRPFDYLLYAGVIIGWSTSWYPLSLQMGTIPAEVSLFWRFAAAALLTFAIARGVAWHCAMGGQTICALPVLA